MRQCDDVLDNPTQMPEHKIKHVLVKGCFAMLSRSVKAAFYACFSPIMRVNSFCYRHLRAPRSGVVKVNLGPGQNNYLPGWINVDANMFTGKCDVWADLRFKLPFRDASVDVVYSHHV